MMVQLQAIIFQLLSGGGVTLTSDITTIYTASHTSVPAASENRCLLHCDTRLSLPISTAARKKFENTVFKFRNTISNYGECLKITILSNYEP
jgi:hypothetical protein